jgi:hypothetical protein
MDHSMGTGANADYPQEKFRWPHDLFLVEYLEREKQKNFPQQKSTTKGSDTIMQGRHRSISFGL